MRSTSSSSHRAGPSRSPRAPAAGHGGNFKTLHTLRIDRPGHRRLTFEQADDQRRAPLGRPALDFFRPLLVSHLPPLWSFDLVLLVARFPRGARYVSALPAS